MSAPLRVMIIEDEALIAMELEMLLEDAGHQVVGWATSAGDAWAMLEQTSADLALVDLHLADGRTGLDIAKHILDAHPTMVVFTTANAALLPDDLAGATAVMAKPYSTHAVRAALSYLVEGIHRPPPRAVKPALLRLSPRFEDAWRAA